MLRSFGLDVLLAGDGPSGIELAQKEQPDLILLDVQMPDMDGFQACRILKSNPKMENIPVLMVTTEDTVKFVDKGLSSGAAGYVLKPFDKAQLRSKISEFVPLPLSGS